ncbi:ATP-binding protein [Neisseria weaveri]|uniref:histidine kinase n=1 Tax=Neisseria weaveri TaxID=28091 RepID=A0A3S4ZDM6_9NEIS|nr:ATP-binding protein [Neisseria weaveri]EGV38958.1 hypothetical protein l11_00370 [Neisseria weaveri LMG 5135]VEJ51454.1 protein BasS [Neisseria weaveri]
MAAIFSRPSIQRRLALLFTLIFLFTAVVAGAVSFYTVFKEVQEFQDDLLRQTALLIDKPGRAGYADIDSDVQIYIQPLDESGKFALSQSAADGFHDIADRKQDDSYRAYVHTYEDGSRYAFIQETDFRDDMAADSALVAVLPLLLLVPISVLLMVWVVWRTLAPVKQLSKEMEGRNESDLSPLPIERIPAEIYGFAGAINRLLGRVGENVREQQRFIADAAHELRSPMTAFSLQAERLASRELPPETAELVADLRDGIRRNRRLLDQLLSMARVKAEEEHPFQEIDVARLYQNVLQDLYPLADAKQLDVGVDGEVSDCACVYAGEADMYTLVKTLLENAIRYTPEGGQIDLRARAANGMCILEIEDSGCGIPLSERKRVFDPFYRILGSDVEGSGLGLPIAKTVAERYGGSISLADSDKFPSGLKVSVMLPLKR